MEKPLPGGSTLERAASVLVLSPGTVGVETCVGLLAPDADGGELEVPTGPPFDRVVVVTVGQSLGTWQSQFEARPSLSGVPTDYVDVRTLVRSTADESDDDAPTPAVTVSSPADLGSLGDGLNDLLSSHGDGRVGVCLYSVTDMLQFVDRELLFKFLFTLSKRLSGTSGVVLYHVDTDISTDELETLFSHCAEAVVAVSSAGARVGPGRYGASEPPR